MKNFDLIELSIVDRLAPLRDGGLIVRSLPDNPQEYGRSLTNGEILIKMLKSTTLPSGKGLSGLGYRSMDTAQCAIAVRLRNLRNGANSGWKIMSAMRSLLDGFVPNGASGQIQPTTSELVDRDDQWWVFQALFDVPTLTVTEELAVDLPLFIRGEFVGEANDTAITGTFEFDVETGQQVQE